MDFIKNLLIDSLNGMSVAMIPLFIFQILVAGFLAHVFQIVINKKIKTELIQSLALISTGICVLASIVKYSLPFAVIGLGVILLFSNHRKEESVPQKLALLMVGIIGVGCGVGSVVQTTIGVLFILSVLLFTPLKKD